MDPGIRNAWHDVDQTLKGINRRQKSDFLHNYLLGFNVGRTKREEREKGRKLHLRSTEFRRSESFVPSIKIHLRDKGYATIQKRTDSPKIQKRNRGEIKFIAWEVCLEAFYNSYYASRGRVFIITRFISNITRLCEMG